MRLGANKIFACHQLEVFCSFEYAIAHKA